MISLFNFWEQSIKQNQVFSILFEKRENNFLCGRLILVLKNYRQQ
jgi:hypothetical protein